MANYAEICGFYSIIADNTYDESTSSLQYFKHPKLPINLWKGISAFKTNSNNDDKMGHILKFTANHKYELLNNHHGKQYITYRGILRIITRCHISRRPWTVIASRYKNIIYLYQYESPEQVIQKPILQNVIFKYRAMFKYHCMSDSPYKASDVPKLYQDSKFFCVLKRNILGRDFLFATQMDGTKSKTPLNPQNFKEWKLDRFVQLNLNCELNSWKRVEKFNNKKLPDLWAMLFPIGAGKVHIGFRDDSGILKEIKSYSSDELGEAKAGHWEDSMGGLEFLNFFLDKVERDLEDIDCPYTTIRYDYDTNTKTVSSTKHEGISDYSCLPEWYLEQINK